MEPSELKMSISVGSTEKKTEIVTLPKSAWFSSYQRYRSQILIKQIKDLNKDFVEILRLYLSYFHRYKPSKSVTVGPDHFKCQTRHLNDSASSKMVIKLYFNFFRFF